MCGCVLHSNEGFLKFFWMHATCRSLPCIILKRTKHSKGQVPCSFGWDQRLGMNGHLKYYKEKAFLCLFIKHYHVAFK